LKKPLNIPPSSQWLSGVGSGSWFHIEKINEFYRIRRFCPKGSVECDKNFLLTNKGFEINKEFEFTYISHCQKCTIKQNNHLYIFLLKDKLEL
tara:strand:- start:316 stop:594 length:279 start_codon:yes stop_codon:yes gene_type:complete